MILDFFGCFIKYCMKKITFTFLSAIAFGSFHMKAQCPPSAQQGFHVVQRGENLYRISLKYGVSIEELYTWNNMVEDEILPSCKKLRILPPSGTNADDERGFNSERLLRKTQPLKQKRPYHIVQNGESLKSIAELYGYTESYFRAFNSLRTNENVGIGHPLLSTDCECQYDTYGQGDSPSSKESAQEVTTYYTESESDYAANASSQSGVSDEYDVKIGKKGRGYHLGTAASLVKIYDEKSTETAPSKISTEKEKNVIQYMSVEERKMIDEINMLRANPSGYIPYVEAYIRDMKEFGEFGNSISTATELIEILRSTPELSSLTPLECLYKTAQEHANNQKPTGDINHQGTDGSWPWDRIIAACEGIQDGNENIVAGPDDVRKLLIVLLVDDGIPSRGHRNNLIDPQWNYVSCYKIGEVGGMPNYWLQLFAK